MFQDQWEGNWKEFSEQPVRALLTRFPSLSLVKKEGQFVENHVQTTMQAVDETIGQSHHGFVG